MDARRLVWRPFGLLLSEHVTRLARTCAPRQFHYPEINLFDQSSLPGRAHLDLAMTWTVGTARCAVRAALSGATGRRRVFVPPALRGRGHRSAMALPVIAMSARYSLILSDTCATSLSPRPERLTITSWSSGILGARSRQAAIAWALSSAGMIPSSRASLWKASSAWSSVASLYSTRF